MEEPHIIVRDGLNYYRVNLINGEVTEVSATQVQGLPVTQEQQH